MSPRACAYCGATGVKLTLEEVFPKFLDRQHPDYTKYLSRAFPNVVLSKSRAVKDVCAPCNNEHLSKLDGYASTFCRQLGVVAPGRVGEIEYDHHLVARWLWKVFYNSARANREPLDLFQPLRPYIRGDAAQPPLPQTLLAGVIKADRCTAEERQTLRSVLLYPKGIRIGTFGIWKLPLTVASFLSINSYLFVALLWAASVTRPQRRFLNAEVMCRDGAIVLPEGRRRMRIPETKMTSREYLSRNSWSPDPVVPLVVPTLATLTGAVR